jgi:cell division protein FtsL
MKDDFVSHFLPEANTPRRFWGQFFLLLGGIGATALAVVLTTFNSRHSLNQLQKLEEERNQLQVEWGQLLLEQSSLVAQGKMEETAISQLNMEVPSMERVVVLTSE